MMHAPYHSRIVDSILEDSKIETVGDPFVGAGSSMNEALVRGLDFVGQDINPLAILLCNVQYGPFYIDALRSSRRRVLDRVETIDGAERPDFLGRDKWFTDPVLNGLLSLRHSILEEQSLWSRRFWWICLAETIRYVSRDRLSTHKLHIHPDKGTNLSTQDVYNTFREIGLRNLEKYEQKKESLREMDVLGRASPDSEIHLGLADTAGEIQWQHSTRNVDLVLTSPPYGDNRTTIPYGQASYLPLALIPEDDLPCTPIDGSTGNTNRLDALSLGGNRRRGLCHLEDHPEVVGLIETHIGSLEGYSESATRRLGLFAIDLVESLKNLLEALSKGAYCVFTIGRRNVDQNEIPVDKIVEDFMCQHGCSIVDRHKRTIGNKRGARRNQHGSTISYEFTSVVEVRG